MTLYLTVIVMLILILAVSCKILWRLEISAKIEDAVKEDKEDLTQDEIGDLIAKIRVGLTNAIINHAPLFEAIAKQKRILNENRRQTVAIFLSEDMSRTLLLTASLTTDEQVEPLLTAVRDLGVPVAMMGDIPVYISTKMSSQVFVAGAIDWEM